jgi:hypothetical protein
VKPISYLNGNLSRDEYISKYRPEHAAIEYINQNTENRSKIYFIFIGKRGYYCERDYLFNMNIIRRLINNSKSPEDITIGLRKQGITHILISFHLFDRWLKDNFSEEKILLTQSFFRQKTSIHFVENGFGVLRLKNH